MSQELLLYTQNLIAAKQEIESLGGRITQQFTDAVFVANLPDSAATQSLQNSSINAPSTLDTTSQIAADAWLGLRNKRELGAPHPGAGLPWDTPGYQSPRKMEEETESSSARVAKSTGTPTSQYMIGSVAVGLVVVSGPSPNLNFSNAEYQKVIQEVQEGLGFLANAEPRAGVNFVYDIHFVTVSAAAGSTDTYENAEAPWRDAALQLMGYTASRQGSVEYVEQLKRDKGTRWAYVAYFTKYPLHHFAYAGQERLVMEYANDGWGTDAINSVFAHETCHIFGAADEYGDCACGGSHGYLGVPNNNCVNCSGTHVPCLMDRNELTICPWTRGQIGWDDRLIGPKVPAQAEVTVVSRSTDKLDIFLTDHQGVIWTAAWEPSFTDWWHGWWELNGGRSAPGAPVHAVSRSMDKLDAFVVGTDNNVYTAAWEPSFTDWWHGWWNLNQGVVAPGAHVTVVSRSPDKLDAFVVGLDGRVWTAAWEPAFTDWWHGWWPIGDIRVPQGAAVHAVSRSTDKLDIFVTDVNGKVQTAAWEPSFTDGWHGWWELNGGQAAPGAPVTVVSRSIDKLDVFVAGMDGRVWTAAWEPAFTDWWHGWWPIGDIRVPAKAPIYAVSRSTDKLDIFATDVNGAIQTAAWEPSFTDGWHGWWELNGGRAAPGAPVTAVSRSTDKLDVFVVGLDGRVWTAAWEPSFTDWWHGWWPITR